ncbi:MAG: Thioredoxin reductase [candidate division TM6 bacterium GW2011_GWF2_30_66]|nr:MAG: Thioredoxin reductase [candidate division TM6 bacterium GW2011_GWF2_30_66]
MANFLRFSKSSFLLCILMVVPACKGVKNESDESFDITSCLGKENLVDILVLGSGPAGLTAAIHGARSRFTTLVLEGNTPGGQLTRSSGIENYPGFPMIPGQDLMDIMRKQTEDFGAEFLSDSAVDIDFSSWPYRVKTENGMIIHAMTLIVTTGSSPRMLGVPGEQEYYGRGLSVCAICDGPMNKNQDVVVIGGGDSAIEEAIQLINFGAKKVTVLVRADKMRAIKSGQDRLKKEENVFIKHNMKVLEIVGDGNDLTGVKVFDKINNETYVIPAHGVFLAIGSYPNTEFLKGKMEMDERNCLKMKDRTQQTTKKAVYAAGDVEAGRPRQAVIAAGMGSQACIEAVKFLSEELGLDRKFMFRLKENYYKGKSDQNNYDKEIELRKLETADQFEKEVLQEASKLVLVDFYTDSCPSCMQMMPIISQLAVNYPNKLLTVKINAADESFVDIVKKYGITRVPRILLFKNGKIVDDIGKALSEKALSDILEKHI